MKSIIYYFSGTGNSLMIANDLAREMQCAKPVSMAGYQGTILTDAEVIGLVFPVYYLNVPELVKDFASRLQINNPSAFVFAVANCGGDAGNTLYNLNRLLTAEGHGLGAGFVLKMPDNSIIFKTPLPERTRDYVLEKQTVKRIADIVTRKEPENALFRFNRLSDILGKIIAGSFRSVIGIKKKTCDNQKCSRCGLCEKLCPVGNITIQNEKVQWGRSCRECFACIHGCPNHAIRFGMLKVDQQSVYRHPEVSFQQIAEPRAYKG